jgi:hypothetical protein
VLDQFGGEDSFKEFQGWTKQEGNLTPAETRNINKALGLDADGKPIEGAKPDFEMAAQLMAPRRSVGRRPVGQVLLGMSLAKALGRRQRRTGGRGLRQAGRRSRWT